MPSVDDSYGEVIGNGNSAKLNSLENRAQRSILLVGSGRAVRDPCELPSNASRCRDPWIFLRILLVGPAVRLFQEASKELEYADTDRINPSIAAFRPDDLEGIAGFTPFTSE